jgi:hypothetical protein
MMGGMSYEGLRVVFYEKIREKKAFFVYLTWSA